MRADFYKLQKDIVDFITAHYPAVAHSEYNLMPLDKSVMSFPDLDRERKNRIAYFDFDEYRFERLTLESDLLTGFVDVYITLRGSATPEKMNEDIAKYAAVFFTVIDDDKTLGATVDEAEVEQIDFYEHAEGSVNYKAAKMRIKFQKEY